MVAPALIAAGVSAATSIGTNIYNQYKADERTREANNFNKKQQLRELAYNQNVERSSFSNQVRGMRQAGMSPMWQGGNIQANVTSSNPVRAQPAPVQPLDLTTPAVQAAQGMANVEQKDADVGLKSVDSRLKTAQAQEKENQLAEYTQGNAVIRDNLVEYYRQRGAEMESQIQWKMEKTKDVNGKEVETQVLDEDGNPVPLDYNDNAYVCWKSYNYLVASLESQEEGASPIGFLKSIKEALDFEAKDSEVKLRTLSNKLEFVTKQRQVRDEDVLDALAKLPETERKEANARIVEMNSRILKMVAEIADLKASTKLKYDQANTELAKQKEMELTEQLTKMHDAVWLAQNGHEQEAILLNLQSLIQGILPSFGATYSVGNTTSNSTTTVIK